MNVNDALIEYFSIGIEVGRNCINGLFSYLFLLSPHFYRGKPVHLTTNEDDIASATDEEPSVIVQLSSRVQDGTRCRIGSLDMCIQGKCQVKSLS